MTLVCRCAVKQQANKQALFKSQLVRVLRLPSRLISDHNLVVRVEHIYMFGPGMHAQTTLALKDHATNRAYSLIIQRQSSRLPYWTDEVRRHTLATRTGHRRVATRPPVYCRLQDDRQPAGIAQPPPARSRSPQTSCGPYRPAVGQPV